MACAALAANPTFAQELAIGEPAPMTAAPLLATDGSQLTLTGLAKENGLLVIFSCNTCPFVVGNGTKTEGWEGRYNGIADMAESLGIGMVLVNSNQAKREGDDSLPEMKKRAMDMEYKAPYVVDDGSKLSIDDNVNRAGEVKERYLEMAMTRMAEGKKIKTPETKAVGCSIKREKKQ